MPDVTLSKSYAGRASTSWWSKCVLAVAAVVSILLVPFDIDVESIVVTLGICAVTYFEFRLNRYFREGNDKAPVLGYRNQSLFAIGILIYGLYHAFFPSPLDVPAEYAEMIDETTLSTMKSVLKIGYLLIGAIGGVSQFCLAWYYRNAKL